MAHGTHPDLRALFRLRGDTTPAVSAECAGCGGTNGCETCICDREVSPCKGLLSGLGAFFSAVTPVSRKGDPLTGFRGRVRATCGEPRPFGDASAKENVGGASLADVGVVCVVSVR